jgi:hypothetical protein
MWWLIGSFLADKCWMSHLQTRSPRAPSIPEGLTVGLQMHSEGWKGPVFYVQPFDAAIHYCLALSCTAAFVMGFCFWLRHHLLNGS